MIVFVVFCGNPRIKTVYKYKAKKLVY